MKLPHGALFAIAFGCVVVGPMVFARSGPGSASVAEPEGGAVRALRPDPSLPTFAEALEQENITLADTGPGSAQREAVRNGLMNAARAYRAAPCSDEAKAAYLTAVTDYGRVRLKSVRERDENEDLWRTVTDKLLKQVEQQQVQHGFVTTREQGLAEIAASPIAAAMVKFSPADEFAGHEPESACAVVRRGGRPEPLTLVHPENMPKLRARGDEEIYRENHESSVRMMLEDPSRGDFCARRVSVIAHVGHYYYMKNWVEKSRAHKQGEAGRRQARDDWNTAEDQEIRSQVRLLILSGRLKRSDFGDLERSYPDLGRLFDHTPTERFECPRETRR
ncbi:MAG: hypothetical protein EON90_11975 [Brevundimonas sp.]|nr:MAG: hypothetical protein EON90_11975 [Brevundimonas sp.]